MPIYVRRCRSCHATFEVNRPMAQADDPPHLRCRLIPGADPPDMITVRGPN